MYKEMVISIVIVLVMFIADYFIQNYTEKNISFIKQDLQEVKQSLGEEKFDVAKEKIEKTENDWNSIKNKLACYIEHNELNKVETSFIMSKSLTELENYDLAINKLDETIFVLENIKERYELKLENIF